MAKIDGDAKLQAMRRDGFRVTKARRELLWLFTKSRSPLSAKEALNQLPRRVNKTTVYRELALFEKLGLLLKITFGDGIARYEIAEQEHHHHLVCFACKKIEDISLGKELQKEERKILAKKGFAVSRHNLEFFGLCRKCAAPPKHCAKADK